MSDLDDALTADLDAPPLDTPEAEQWRITDDRLASWTARKVRALEVEIARLRGQADDERARIDAWLDDATHGALRRAAWFREHLEGYYRAKVAADPETPRTYRVLGAVLKRRKNPGRVDVTNETEFVVWALANDDRLVRVAPDKAAVKAHTIAGDGGQLFSDSGELIPGVVWVAGEDRYEVGIDP